MLWGKEEARRVVNDGAIGSRTGNGWEAQVHKVGLLPAEFLSFVGS